MGRKIELEFYDKKYVIEYNRSSVREVLNNKSDDDLENAIILIKSGLVMHHKDELPSDEDIFAWVMALGDDISEFANALREMVQGVLDTFKEDRKNLKWGKVEA